MQLFCLYMSCSSATPTRQLRERRRTTEKLVRTWALVYSGFLCHLPNRLWQPSEKPLSRQNSYVSAANTAYYLFDMPALHTPLTELNAPCFYRWGRRRDSAWTLGMFCSRWICSFLVGVLHFSRVLTTTLDFVPVRLTFPEIFPQAEDAARKRLDLGVSHNLRVRAMHGNKALLEVGITTSPTAVTPPGRMP